MELKYSPDPFPHVIVHNFFDENEMQIIWRELKFLTHKSKMLPPENTGTAKSEDGRERVLKSNAGLFLYETYSDPRVSDIIMCASKIFRQDFIDTVYDLNYQLRHIKKCDTNGMLLSYYEDGDNYESHIDRACLSVLINFFEEPKAFTGGDLIFPDFRLKIPAENNRLLLFPSTIDHEVTKVNMEKSDSDFSGKGRYTLSLFLNYKTLMRN